MFATGVTMGVAEWIIDNTCLVGFVLQDFEKWGWTIVITTGRDCDLVLWINRKGRDTIKQIKMLYKVLKVLKKTFFLEFLYSFILVLQLSF